MNQQIPIEMIITDNIILHRMPLSIIRYNNVERSPSADMIQITATCPLVAEIYRLKKGKGENSVEFEEPICLIEESNEY